MLSFHNDPEIKEFYLNRLRQHYAADEFVKGKYWENGKGCAVGCTIHGSDPLDMADKLGIDEKICYLDDVIFEGLPNNLSKVWPIRFLETIPVGVDTSKIWPHFAIFLLLDETQCAERHEQCKIIADLYQKEINGSIVNWDAARAAARAAAWDAVGDAAWDAADAARDAADAAWDAADAAAWDAAWNAARAAAAANEKAYIAQADKLIELLKQCV